MTKFNAKSVLGIGIAAVVLAVIFVPLSDAASVFGAKGGNHGEKSKHSNSNSVLAANLSQQVDSHDNKVSKHVQQVIEKKMQSTSYGNNIHEDQKYALTATGIATDKPITNSVDGYSYSATPAELNLDLDLWRSAKWFSVLKITDGTIELGDETYEVESGYLVFRPNAHKITAYAFIDDGDNYSNQKILLKINAKTLTGSGLPDESGDPAVQFEIQSPQSKVVPGIFLKMDGEIKLA